MPLLSMNCITTYLFLTMEDVIRVVERFQHCCPLIPSKNCRVLVQKGKEKMTTAGPFWPDKHLFEILPSGRQFWCTSEAPPATTLSSQRQSPSSICPSESGGPHPHPCHTKACSENPHVCTSLVELHKLNISFYSIPAIYLPWKNQMDLSTFREMLFLKIFTFTLVLIGTLIQYQSVMAQSL